MKNIDDARRCEIRILRAARDILATPGQWTQGRFAADGYGDFVYPTSPEAKCWCIQGATIRARDHIFEDGALNADATPGVWLTVAAKAMGFETASKLNDAPTTTHADVLALFDLAIKLADDPDA